MRAFDQKQQNVTMQAGIARQKTSLRSCFRIISTLLLLTSSLSVIAVELARVEGFGPVSRGFAGGGVAYPIGTGALMLNPAELLTLESEHEFMFQFTQIHADISVANSNTGEKISNANVGHNRGPYDLPEIAYARRIGNWAFGAGIFAAGGFGIEYGTESFLSHTTTNNVATGLPVSTRVGQLRIPFAVAWQPAPQWRLGASLDIVNASVNLASLFDVQQIGQLLVAGRASGSLVPALGSIPGLSGVHLNFVRNNYGSSALSAVGIAGHLGLSYQVNADTVVALLYEAKSALPDVKGQGQLTAVDSANHHIVLSGKGRLPEFQFPEAWTLGISHRVSPNFAFVADVRETHWADVLSDMVVDFRANDGRTLHVSLPTGFKDLTTVTLGAEWKVRPEWTLRVGGSHTLQQLVPSRDLSGTFPTLTRNHLTAMLSFRPDAAQEFSAGCSYGFSDVVRNPGGNVNSVPPISGRNRQFNPSIAYRSWF